MLGKSTKNLPTIPPHLVPKNDTIGANPKSVITLQFTIKRLDVAFLIPELAQGIPQPAPGFGRTSSEELRHLLRNLNLHRESLKDSISAFLPDLS